MMEYAYVLLDTRVGAIQYGYINIYIITKLLQYFITTKYEIKSLLTLLYKLIEYNFAQGLLLSIRLLANPLF